MSTLTPTQARTLLGIITRRKASTPADVADARRDLAEANISAAIERELAKAPPLTDEQAERIAARLRGVTEG